MVVRAILGVPAHRRWETGLVSAFSRARPRLAPLPSTLISMKGTSGLSAASLQVFHMQPSPSPFYVHAPL